MVRVTIGPAPAPGKADPTPLNCTRVTTKVPAFAYVWVGLRPAPVKPSPNSHRLTCTGWALMLENKALKFTVRPCADLDCADEKPLEIPFCPVTTIPPAPVDSPPRPITVKPTENAPADGKV